MLEGSKSSKENLKNVRKKDNPPSLRAVVTSKLKLGSIATYIVRPVSYIKTCPTKCFKVHFQSNDFRCFTR